MKRMKSVLLLILCVGLLTLFTGCGEVKKAETAVNGMLTAFQNLNFEEAQQYVNVEDITKTGNEANEKSMLIMETVFKNLSYEIVSSEKTDNNTVLVKTKITATDMKPVMGEFVTESMQYAFSAAFANPQPTEEEANKAMEEILIACASKPNLATVTEEVDIKVVHVKGEGWRIEADEAFVNALLGNLIDVAKDLESSFNTAE